MLKQLTLEEAIILLDACPVAVLVIDAAGQVRGLNEAFANLAGEDAVAGLAGSSPDPHNDALLAPLLGKGTLINWIMPDGDTRWLAVTSAPLQGGSGGMVRFYQDVTEKLRLKQERDSVSAELREQSLKDATLTSLLNRRGILLSLDPLVARSRRYNSPLSIIAMGLETGQEREKTLVKVSYLLRDQTRWADLVGCNQGHDFILILQETTRDAALLLVNKLQGHLTRMSDTEPAPLQACYGVTDCQKNDNGESLLERAEAALRDARGNPEGVAIA